MNLNKLFIVFTGGLILTHAVNSLMISSPFIGIMIWDIIIWSFPLAIFFFQAWFKPTARVYQIFSFIILIYFMNICLDIPGLPNLTGASLLFWLELTEIVIVFFVACYAAREQLRNVK